MRHRPSLPVAAALAAACLAAGPGRAAGVSHTMEVTAQVQTGCDIGGSTSGALAAGRIDFGSHLSDDTALPVVSGTMLVRCAGSATSPSISFDLGAHADSGRRNLVGPGGALVPYVLLRSSDPSGPQWDDQSYPITLASDGKGDLTVYARIPALPLHTPDGSYTDTIMVRLDY
jgi:spore coat protein U-like protein